jgi:hypothetical protein
MVERDTYYETIYGDAMLEEMDKIAGIGTALKHMLKRPAGAAKGLSSAGAGRLVGTGIGAGVGAAGGAAANPEDRTGGALRGALLGGVAGLAGGQVATKAGRGQVKRFGQRQLHGMTGYVPRTAAQKAQGIGFAGKGLSADQRVAALKNIGMDVGSKVTNRSKALREAMENQVLVKKLSPNVRKRLAGMEVGGIEARRRAAEQGLTSIPGVLKGMAKNPLQTLKTGFQSQGPTGMMLATVPTAMMIPGAVSGKGYGSEEYGGRGGVGKMIGENLGYAALGAAPIAPMIAGAALAGKAGELIHRGGKAQVERAQAGRVRT